MSFVTRVGRRGGNRRCSGGTGPAPGARDIIFFASWAACDDSNYVEMMSFRWRQAERRDRRAISRHGGKLWEQHGGQGPDDQPAVIYDYETE